ncbi:MAG: Re/Si-specific NAD(P)(+) transhydrogenase subunit alpha [Thauera sp.]|nr:Re/Si-specific NAD(P)(+) transhydrogenase subunit alpha [Thauera sp.]
MPLVIGVLKEVHPGERRLSVVPDVVKKYQGLGASVVMQKDAAKGAHFRDTDFADVTWVDSAADVVAAADVVLCVQPPAAETLAAMKPGSVLCGMLQPWYSAERVQQLVEGQVTAFALELLPRISRAQSMDILSSQGAVAGYECALIAADHSPKFFPMLTYAAGSIRPAKVLVIGAGVAGLQAIATARRLGGVVTATDVRPAVKEQVQSLGAKFIAVEDDEFKQAETAGGYAKEMSKDYQAKQAALVAEHIKKQDIVITTALIPGRPAPKLVSAEMVKSMRPGSVLVDLAVERGGNVEGARLGEVVLIDGVKIVGHANVPGRLAASSSALYAKNLLTFLDSLIDKKEKTLAINWDDELVKGTALTRDGAVIHPNFKPKTAA